MKVFTGPQLKVLSGFFSNMAVVWFTASFIGIHDFALLFQYVISGILSLVAAMRLAKEVSNI